MLFSNFGYLKHWKLLNVCHSRLEILPNINKPSKDCQRVLKNGQSGKISPNLVTLVARNSWFISPPAPKKKLKRKFHNALAKLNCKWSLKMQHSRQHFYLHFALAYYSIKKIKAGNSNSKNFFQNRLTPLTKIILSLAAFVPRLFVYVRLQNYL